MPTVGRFGPYRVYFYTNEGTEPPHVHIQREDKFAKFWQSPVILAWTKRFPAAELRKLERLVAAHRERLMEAWHENFPRRGGGTGPERSGNR
jgi:hypothetical protein